MIILSIGIATYQRGELAKKRVDELIRADLPDFIEIYFIDNFSQDGSYEELMTAAGNSKVSVYRNESNLGFAGNFVEIVRKAKSEFILWCSDEDQLIFENIIPLINFLKKKSPDIAVTDYYIKHQDYIETYRKNSQSLLVPEKYWSIAPHLPGMIFKAKVAKTILHDFENLKLEYPHISKYYPQFFLFFELLPRRNCWFFNRPISMQVDFEDDLHPKTEGNFYWMLPSRWAQVKEIDSYLSKRINNTTSVIHKKILISMKIASNIFIYDLIRSSIVNERPDLLTLFDHGAKARVHSLGIFNASLRVIKLMFLNPILAMEKLKKAAIQKIQIYKNLPR